MTVFGDFFTKSTPNFKGMILGRPRARFLSCRGACFELRSALKHVNLQSTYAFTLSESEAVGVFYVFLGSF